MNGPCPTRGRLLVIDTELERVPAADELVAKAVREVISLAPLGDGLRVHAMRQRTPLRRRAASHTNGTLPLGHAGLRGPDERVLNDPAHRRGRVIRERRQ
jgi:hypothetical protein